MGLWAGSAGLALQGDGHGDHHHGEGSSQNPNDDAAGVAGLGGVGLAGLLGLAGVHGIGILGLGNALVGRLGQAAGEDEAADEGVLIGLVDLVVQDVGEQSDVQVAVLILKAHHAVVVLVELSGQLLIGQADAALQGGLTGVLHQNGSALGELGEPVGAVLVHHVVSFVDVAGVDQGVVGIHHATQEVGALVAGGDLHAQLLHEGRTAGDGAGAVAHVRRTGLHGGQGVVAEGAGAHDDVGLGQILGHGKAHGG